MSENSGVPAHSETNRVQLPLDGLHPTQPILIVARKIPVKFAVPLSQIAAVVEAESSDARGLACVTSGKRACCSPPPALERIASADRPSH